MNPQRSARKRSTRWRARENSSTKWASSPIATTRASPTMSLSGFEVVEGLLRIEGRQGGGVLAEPVGEHVGEED